MGNAGRNGGEYYTPRPLIRAIIQVVKPQIGDRIYDRACGAAGFLCGVTTICVRVISRQNSLNNFSLRNVP
ncbi:MAG: N-6 DNA methylase [Nostoc sp.]|uniref:N-6 DNA methylase n=1 Tax=Nostoc sp. TaxID=1180 RepID=UPI002FF973E3